MRIGIDARFLTHPQPGGFKTYTTNLITTLGEIDRDNDYVVYVDRRPADPGALPAHPNFTCQMVHGTLPGLGMPLREQVLLRRRIAVDRLDLVHFLCNTATIGLRTRHVVTLHDTIQLTPRTSITVRRTPADRWRRAQAAYSNYTTRRAARTASRLIAVSHHEKQSISVVLGVPPERVSVIHSAPDPAFVLADGHEGKPAGVPTAPASGVRSPYILGVGYEPRKNIELLIEVFAELATERHDLQLVVVAAHEGRRRELQAHVRDRGLEPRAVILGALPTPCLARLYRGAEALVFPSEREGFGLPPLEAMASGIPTVAMRASSVPEVVGDGALLVDGAEVGKWVAAVRHVLSSPALRADLVRRGLERAATFSWTRCAEQTIAVYRGVHSRSAGS